MEQDMNRKLTTLAAIGALGFFSLSAAVFADESGSSAQRPNAMMGDQGGMTNMMDEMGADHVKQMTQMVDGCNRMMASMGAGSTTPEVRIPETAH
jgi:hypothetical protein